MVFQAHKWTVQKTWTYDLKIRKFWKGQKLWLKTERSFRMKVDDLSYWLYNRTLGHLDFLKIMISMHKIWVSIGHERCDESDDG